MRAVKTRIVKIGNSRGVRIPKIFLDELHLEGEVEMTVQDNQLVIMSVHQPRRGWAEALDEMAKRGDDALLDSEEEIQIRWEQEEWEWPCSSSQFRSSANTSCQSYKLTGPL